jgi:hypothetical protein
MLHGKNVAAAHAGRPRLRRALFLACVVFALALWYGCAHLPNPGARNTSVAIEGGADTPLGRSVLDGAPDAATSGIRLLPLPRFALHAREELVRRAQRSIDLQYYLIENDATGRFLLRTLRDAAKRGVRVRVLVDDFYTASSDDLLRTLAAYPNIEVRLFNPFPAGRGTLSTRVATSIFDLDRINRRMHNMLLPADNIVAIAGGRNIADGYFQHDATTSFIDMDVFAVGQFVDPEGRAFGKFGAQSTIPIRMAKLRKHTSSSPCVRVAPSGVHGLGAFATRALPAFALLGLYEGRRYSQQEIAARAWDDQLTYLFTLSNQETIDGAKGGNGTRHLNHACDPNCEAVEEYDDAGRLVLKFQTIVPVDAGDELFIDYFLTADDGSAPSDYPCHCGSPNCRGTMLAPVEDG